MRIKEIKYNNIDSLIIYITEEEKNDEIIKEKINNYKKSYRDISIFISGNRNIEDVLKKMVQDKM